MRSRFPELKDLGPVSPVEWGTLKALNLACVELQQEAEAAAVQVGRATTRCEVADAYTESGSFPYHHQAVREAYTIASAYEREIERLTWRYASASAVLGVAVLDRLINGRPPLQAVLVEQIASSEPRVADLREALSMPARLLRPHRDEEFQRRAETDRQRLLGSLEAMFDLLTSEGIDGTPLSEAQADACRLGPASPAGVDPYWLELLKPVLSLSESLPYEIAHHVGSTRS